MSKHFSVKVGDRVAFRHSFLKSIHAAATDEKWHKRGEVKEVQSNPNVAKVLWDGESETSLVLMANLAHVGANIGFAG